jgi:hypothetical protein
MFRITRKPFSIPGLIGILLALALALPALAQNVRTFLPSSTELAGGFMVRSHSEKSQVSLIGLYFLRSDSQINSFSKGPAERREPQKPQHIRIGASGYAHAPFGPTRRGQPAAESPRFSTGGP